MDFEFTPEQLARATEIGLHPSGDLSGQVREDLMQERMLDAIVAIDKNAENIQASLNAEVKDRRAADAENAKQSKRHFWISLSVAIFAVALTVADMLLRLFGIL